MKTPKAVVFDLGNVLLRWDPDKLYRELIPDAGQRKAFFDETEIMLMNEAVDRGRPLKEAVAQKISQFPHHAAHIQAWHDRWTDMAYALIPLTARVIRHLRAEGVPVFALSNFGHDTFDYAASIYPELLDFDRHFISGRLKTIKPEPRIYEILEEESGLGGDDLIFFDDLTTNIEAAQARGWQGRVFTTPERMVADLGDVGLADPAKFG